MSEFEHQWSTAAMPDFSLMDDRPEYDPRSSEDDGLEYQPSSSEEDEWEYEPRPPHKTRNDIQSDQDSVTLKHHHLSDDADLEVGTVSSIGDTLELHGGSFLMITELKRSKNGRTVKFVGYLFKPIEDFEDYLPVEFASSELVWVCEATGHDPKPEGYRRYAHNKDVLRIRHIAFTYSPASFSEFQATRMFTDIRPLVFQWRLETEPSNSHSAGKVRSFGSISKQGQGQPRAFTALSNQELSVGGTMAALIFPILSTSLTAMRGKIAQITDHVSPKTMGTHWAGTSEQVKSTAEIHGRAWYWLQLPRAIGSPNSRVALLYASLYFILRQVWLAHSRVHRLKEEYRSMALSSEPTRLQTHFAVLGVCTLGQEPPDSVLNGLSTKMKTRSTHTV